MANTRVLFVPWRQIESVEHYAARRDLPTTEDQFGRLMFDLKEPRGPTPWRKMLEPLTEYEVVNPTMAMHKDFSIKAEKQNKIERQALEGNYPGQEYKSKNLNWKAAEAEKGASKDWFEVWYSGRVSPIIFGLRTVEEQIYIRGHGQPGDSGIYSGGFNWRLGAEEVAKRLIASGLQTSFAGKIKCYNCHSAEQGIHERFAQALADYLYSKGYKSCEFFGYYGALDSYPGANDAGTKPDDSSNPGETGKSKGDLTPKYKTSFSDEGLCRASARRRLIIPNMLVAELEKNLAKLKPF
jgi:hypothetical protein